ncbi:Signal peptidase I [Halorhabdus sp. SVX81]|nr:Signal peptidase I [Halorhabdus sp. SVX81]
MSDSSDDRDPADRERDRREPDPDVPSKSGDADADREDDEAVAPDEQSAQERPESGHREGESPISSSEEPEPGNHAAPEDRQSGVQPPQREREHRAANREQAESPTQVGSVESTTRPLDSEKRKPPRKGRSGRSDTGRLTRLLQYTFDIASSVLIVVLIGALLFATSGVWPPLVAIESPSMEPNIDTGDLVFVMDEQRFPGPGAIEESGVVPARAGEETGYRMFNGYGDVIIYEPDGNGAETPIIHRAMFWVEANESWYDRADPTAIGNADSCAELANCPAPNAGFITKGDNNQRYDQVGNQFSGPVKPEWVIGTAEYRVPGLGQVRLLSGDVRSTNETTSAVNVTSVGMPAIAP